MSTISNYFIPAIVFFVLVYALRKKVNVYDSFCHGAKEGILMSIEIFPFLMAMIFGMNILLKSGFITDFFSLFRPVLEMFHIPVEIMPLAVTRPVSGNASFVVMIDIIKQYGVDSNLGRMAAILQGATDTTIYVLSLYFGSIGIKHIRYALKAGLLTDLITVIMALLLVTLFFA